MKLVSLLSVLLFSLSSQASLHTFEFVAGSQFQLVEYQLDEAHQPRGQITGGKLTIGKSLVELNIRVKKVCPPGRFCTMEMPAPIYVKLPIVEIEKSDCGNRIVAQMDGRPVDGSLEQLVITDYTGAVCAVDASTIEVEYTTAYYDRVNGGEVEAVSTFDFAPAKTTFPVLK
jgi:hypothetical protein